MCELLALTANVPTDICFSFAGLIERGGNTGPHKDGWGITFYEGKGSRTFKDPNPSAESKIAELVRSYPIKSCSTISHIRQANRGAVNLENTHPFSRELWGRNFTYAHNGQLSNYDHLAPNRFKPVGDTDSELAFCWLLECITDKFKSEPECFSDVFNYVASKCDELRALGIFNMLLSDGEYMLAYCTNNLHWITRKAPFGEASLIDKDVQVDFKQETTPNDIVTIVATRPLTDNESWIKMKEGEAILFKFGEVCK